MTKLLGRLTYLILIAGTAAAAVSYYRRYSEFHRDPGEGFHDCEEDGESDHVPHIKTPGRNYVSLNANRGEFTAAAWNTLKAVKDMVSNAAGILRGIDSILAGNLQTTSGKRVTETWATIETVTEVVRETTEAAADGATGEAVSENILAKSYAVAGGNARHATEVTEGE